VAVIIARKMGLLEFYLYMIDMFVLTCTKSQKDERKFACIEAKAKL